MSLDFSFLLGSMINRKQKEEKYYRTDLHIMPDWCKNLTRLVASVQMDHRMAAFIRLVAAEVLHYSIRHSHFLNSILLFLNNGDGVVSESMSLSHTLPFWYVLCLEVFKQEWVIPADLLLRKVIFLNMIPAWGSYGSHKESKNDKCCSS